MFVALALATGACSGGKDDALPAEVDAVRIAVPGDASIDPAMADDPVEITVARLISTSLLVIAPGATAPTPGLASSYDVDDGQQRFTFHLADDAEWSDGEAVTGADVVDALEHVRDPATASPLAPLLADVATIESPDDATVVVATTRPASELPVILAHPGFGVGDMDRGTGDYVVTARGPGTVVLSNGDRSIELVATADTNAAMLAFERRQADLVYASAAFADKFSAAYGSSGFQPYGAVSLLGLYLGSPKLGDVRLREAIVRAIDASAVVASAYGGTAVTEERMVPASMIAAPPDSCDAACEQDLARARQLVNELYPSGGAPTVAIDYDEGEVGAAVATAVVEQLAAVGIPAAPRGHSPDTYGAFLASGQAEVFRFAWVSEYAGTGALLDPLFRSDGFANAFGLQSAAVDAALDAARTDGDVTGRSARYAPAVREVLATWCVRPLATLESRWIGRDIDGITVDPLGALDPDQLSRH